MISVSHLTKTYGPKTVVDDLSFEVRPGVVTGFLGPNGAGKSTTMRMIVGLDRATRGSATIAGKRVRDDAAPMRQVGVLLDAGYLHPTRSARDHLWAMAASNGLPRRRVDDMLALVGLADAARRRVGTFSLGMKQRLGLAGAMLGDPQVIILDEPANGLDPEGVHWIRTFLSHLASEGRTVFVSSHLLSEMSLMAEDLVIIGTGKLIAQTTVKDLTERASGSSVIVRSPSLAALGELLTRNGAQVRLEGDTLIVAEWDAADVGRLAFGAHIELHELAHSRPTLEDAFLELTSDTQEYRTTSHERTTS
jgi:ABC-2 type transport system ATP-binding protein